MTGKVVVVKFGGSCLSDPSSILRAAEKIAEEVEKGSNILVVVSALKGETDRLVNLAQKSTSDRVSKRDLDEIMSMGERLMVRLVAASLRSLGLRPIAIEPSSSLWPLHTDSGFGEARVDLEATEKAAAERILPLLEETFTPVVAGFLGLSPQGEVTTIGRGGSDITAVVLGRILGASEVIFVKDVEGVLSADPKRMMNPRKIDLLKAEEAYSLANAGARVIHPKALTYKRDSMNLRVVGFGSKDLSGGTLITGELNEEIEVAAHPNSLSMITLVTSGVALPQVLAELLSKAISVKAEVRGVALTSNSILLYVEGAARLLHPLHEMIKGRGLAKALHCIDSLAMIEVTGYNLEQIPGVVNGAVAPLSGEGINLYGVLTISSSVKIFVPWSERLRSLHLIENSLKNLEKRRRS